jgi:hypothetical protein
MSESKTKQGVRNLNSMGPRARLRPAGPMTCPPHLPVWRTQIDYGLRIDQQVCRACGTVLS